MSTFFKHYSYTILLSDHIIPRVCPKCFKVFKNKMTLAKHLRLQCGTEAKYVCSYCGKKFKRNDNMKRHIQHVHRRRMEYVPCANKFVSLDYWKINSGVTSVNDSGISSRKYGGIGILGKPNSDRHNLEIRVNSMNWKTETWNFNILFEWALYFFWSTWKKLGCPRCQSVCIIVTE